MPNLRSDTPSPTQGTDVCVWNIWKDVKLLSSAGAYSTFGLLPWVGKGGWSPPRTRCFSLPSSLFFRSPSLRCFKCVITLLVQACVQSKDLNQFFASVCSTMHLGNRFKASTSSTHSSLSTFHISSACVYVCMYVCMCNCDLEERAKRRQKGLDRCRMMARARKHKEADRSSYSSSSRFSDWTHPNHPNVTKRC